MLGKSIGFDLFLDKIAPLLETTKYAYKTLAQKDGFEMSRFLSREELIKLQKESESKLKEFCKIFSEEFQIQFQETIKKDYEGYLPENFYSRRMSRNFSLNLSSVINILRTAFNDPILHDTFQYAANLLNLVYKFAKPEVLSQITGSPILFERFLQVKLQLSRKQKGNEEALQEIYKLYQMIPSSIVFPAQEKYYRLQFLNLMGYLIKKCEEKNKEAVTKIFEHDNDTLVKAQNIFNGQAFEQIFPAQDKSPDKKDFHDKGDNKASTVTFLAPNATSPNSVDPKNSTKPYSEPPLSEAEKGKDNPSTEDSLVAVNPKIKKKRKKKK